MRQEHILFRELKESENKELSFLHLKNKELQEAALRLTQYVFELEKDKEKVMSTPAIMQNWIANMWKPSTSSFESNTPSSRNSLKNVKLIPTRFALTATRIFSSSSKRIIAIWWSIA